MQETKGKRCGPPLLVGRSWAARHTEEVRRRYLRRPHSLGQKEGGIHRYLDTPKEICNSRCTGGISKRSSPKKDNREFSHSHVPIKSHPTDAPSLRIDNVKCCCKPASCSSVYYYMPDPDLLHSDSKRSITTNKSAIPVHSLCPFFSKRQKARTHRPTSVFQGKRKLDLLSCSGAVVKPRNGIVVLEEINPFFLFAVSARYWTEEVCELRRTYVPRKLQEAIPGSDPVGGAEAPAPFPRRRACASPRLGSAAA